VDWVDILHYPSLVEHLRVHDATLDKLGEYCRKSANPDGFGILDSIEEAIGQGFFFMQRYMIQRKRTKQNAFTCGPRLGSFYFAQVINAAANYWKHLDEWPATIQPGSREHHTLRVLTETGATQSDYRLSQLLYVLEPQRSLSALLPRIVEWRTALDLATS
jgi:hypothetical protein